MLTNLKRQGMGKLGLEPQILEEAEMLMAHLEELSVFDPNKILAAYTSNNIMRMVSGQRWMYGDPAYKEFIDAINKILDSLGVLILEDLVPVFRFLPDLRKARKEATAAMAHIRSLFREIIEKRMVEADSAENEDFIHSYLQAHDEMGEAEVVELLDLCQIAFIAGTETTSATLNFAIIHLLNDPAWQEELFQEVRTVLGGGMPSMAILEKLPKLEATIQVLADPFHCYLDLKIYLIEMHISILERSSGWLTNYNPGDPEDQPEQSIDLQGDLTCDEHPRLRGARQLHGSGQRLPHQLRPSHLPQPGHLFPDAVASL